jgi:hypothetical protein
MRAAVALSLVLVVTTGCKKTDDLYCCMTCTTPVACDIGERCEESIHTCVEDIGGACTMSSDCADEPMYPYCVDEVCVAICSGDQSCNGAAGADGPYCLNGACVECSIATQAQDCGGMTPVCDDGVCSACDVDEDCGNDGVCLISGACAATNRILYASTVGANTTCSFASPCAIDEALRQVNTTRDIVKLAPGVYTINPRPSEFDLMEDVIITGRGADLNLDIVNSPVLRVEGANVTLIGMIIRDGANIPGDGVVCDNAALTIHEVTITQNAQLGIRATNCALAVSRSTLVLNNGGGIFFDSMTTGFQIVNNIIARNGNPSGSFRGGLDLQSGVTGNRVEFNTIAENFANNEPGGLICGGGEPAMVANNIIAGNTRTGTMPEDQITPGCDTSNSILRNDVVDFQFVNPMSAPYDYHLSSESSIAVDGASGSQPHDIDGERRPNGSAPDHGADEFYP